MIFRTLTVAVALLLSSQLLAKGHGGKRFFSKIIGKHTSIINSGKQAIASTKSNLARTIVAAGTAVVLACGVGGLSGCGGEDGSVPLVLVTDAYGGEHVHFTLDGLLYQGYVSGGVSSTAIKIVLDGGNSVIVDQGLVDGVLLPNHPDVGGEVYLYGEPNGNSEFLYATISRVYNDAMYELIVDSEVDFDGNVILLAEPYALFISSRLTLEDGGFEFFD